MQIGEQQRSWENNDDNNDACMVEFLSVLVSQPTDLFCFMHQTDSELGNPENK